MRKSLLILTLLLAACVTGEEEVSAMMASWVGHTENELLLKWGPPVERHPDGAGGEIIVYRKVQVDTTTNPWGNRPGRIVYDSKGNATYYPPKTAQTYTNTSVMVRMFFVNSDHRIYAWRWQGF